MSYKYVYRQTSNSSPRSNFGASKNPVGITIHHWGADGQTHSAVVNWLAGVGNKATSAHYVVSSGLVTQLETDYRATWHAGNGKGNGTTIGIEMRPEMSDGDWATLVDLCVTIEKEHGSMKYYRHRDWKATACPGRYSGMIAKLVNDVNAAHGGKKPSAPSDGSTGTASKSVSQMASEVVAGKHGSGHANRQRSLGVNNATYQKVRNEVNQRAGGSTSTSSSARPSKSISQMATEVINGRHGSGHANRRRSLGVNASTYAKVRAEVNRRAGGGSSGGGKSISQMAAEVLKGKHGNGHANRQRSLGVNNATYAAVRKEVNRRS